MPNPSINCCCDGGSDTGTPVSCATCWASWPTTLYFTDLYGTVTLTYNLSLHYYLGCQLASYSGQPIPISYILSCGGSGFGIQAAWPTVGHPIYNCSSFPMDSTPTNVWRRSDGLDGVTIDCSNWAGAVTCTPMYNGAERILSGAIPTTTTTCRTPVNATIPLPASAYGYLYPSASTGTLTS